MIAISETISPTLLLAVIAVFSLVIGSFLNVVIYRLPQQLYRRWQEEAQALADANLSPPDETAEDTLLWPASRCPKCLTPIKPWHNIPLLGYLLLRGRCNHCGEKISLQYPLVELISGVLVVVAFAILGFTIGGIYAAIFTFVLITLAAIDANEKLLPDQLTLPLLWLGLLINIDGTFVPLSEAVIGAVSGYLFLWTIYWLFKLATGKEGMGYGDFKLLAALGAWLGWQMLPLIVLLSSALGAIVGLCMILFRNRGRNSQIPFGPFLASAGWIAMIWGDNIVSWYLSSLSLS
jgi:leader peptidase (prepilin peptidase)/N-methyltransferase